MYKYIIIALIFALILISIIYTFYRCEKEPFLSKLKQIHQKPQLLDDKLFADVQTYDNTYYKDGAVELGLNKCLKACTGTCLEYGVTGVAHCFPKTKALGMNYYTIAKDYNNEIEDIDRAGRTLVYPALR